MAIKLNNSQIGLIIVSIIIILYSLILLKYDNWGSDLFYFLHLFNLFIALDFIYYILKCSPQKGKSHYVFCSFPLSRFQLLCMELRYYLVRWEFIVLILSFLFFICYFFLLTNNNLFDLIVLVIVYLVQITYLITILFIIKNMIKNKNLDSDLKNLISIYISLMVLMAIFADKSQKFLTILFINPLSNGFLAYLMGLQFGILGTILSICLAIMIILVAKKKFKVWDLY